LASWNDEPVDTDAWEAACIYDPDAPDAAERLALLEYLSARGATLEQLVEGDRLTTLPAVAGDLVLATHRPTVSIEELAARCGVPVELVERVLLAAGLAAGPDSRLPEGLDALIATFLQGVSLMGEDAILAFTRVLGGAATTIAEAAVALFYAELGPGTEREGFDELARAHISERAVMAFTAIPEVLSRVLLAQFDRATHRAALARGWEAPEEGDGPSEVVALGFVDLVGSTAWAETLSLRDQSLALSRFESAAWSATVLSGGRVVKMIGDEAFFAAPSVDDACRIGAEICQMAADDPVLPPARAAVGFGPVTPREGDYFGPLVNVVSRLVKVAAPGELVATEEAVSRLPEDRWELRELDPQQLRGVDHDVRAFAVSGPGSRTA
jgi:class 3 adenylate cyclase